MLALFAVAAVLAAVEASEGPLIQLKNGVQYQCKSEHDGDSCRGIRYGQAPVGKLRWAPPLMYAADAAADTPEDASKLASVCPQSSCGNTGCSEDCLFLNIFMGHNATEQAVSSGDLLPVAIFVHGGSYMSGSGNLYPGGPVVNFWDGKGILVTINYRLAALGFLGGEALRALDAKDGSTGNMGIQDQRLAFQWVQDNIAAFGGDKDRVMIFGESAGAGSMTMHLTMKKSFGLYSRAVLESGAFSQWNMQPMAHAQASYDSFTEAAGCGAEDIACLQALSVDAVWAAFKALPAINVDTYIFGPTVDGVEATTHSWIAAADGDVNPVPVMFGTNRDEGSMFCDLPETATFEELQAYWALYGVDEAGQQTLANLYLDGKTYPTINDQTTYWYAGLRSLGDDAMSCPANYASSKLHEKQPVFQYFFQHESKYATEHDGLVIHGSELPYVLHLENVFLNVKDRKMADIMASYWGNFLMSESGNPNEHHVGGKHLPEWPQYTAQNPIIMNIVDYDDSKPELDIKKEVCDFWIPFVDEAIRASN